jgi:histidinol phosphatase-like PHP family hydrolase
MARHSKAPLILNTDSHAPHDLVSKEMARKIALGAGMTEEEAEIMFHNSEALVKKALEKK